MSIEIKLVEIPDASFILDLRCNQRLNKYLSVTTPNISLQQLWIKEYKERENRQEEFYFIIIENGQRRGLYRIYKINNTSFTIGSWLFQKCDFINLPIITDIVISDFGFNTLNRPVLLFDVRKDNRKVINYHLLKKPLVYNEDDLNYYYLIQRNDWNDIKANLMSFFNVQKEHFDHMKEQLNLLYRP